MANLSYQECPSQWFEEDVIDEQLILYISIETTPNLYNKELFLPVRIWKEYDIKDVSTFQFEIESPDENQEELLLSRLLFSLEDEIPEKPEKEEEMIPIEISEVESTNIEEKEGEEKITKGKKKKETLYYMEGQPIYMNTIYYRKTFSRGKTIFQNLEFSPKMLVDLGLSHPVIKDTIQLSERGLLYKSEKSLRFDIKLSLTSDVKCNVN